MGKKSLRVGCRALQDFYNAKIEIHLHTDLPAKATAELGLSWKRKGRTMVHRQKRMMGAGGVWSHWVIPVSPEGKHSPQSYMQKRSSSSATTHRQLMPSTHIAKRQIHL